MIKILKNIKRFLFACILLFPAILMACSENSEELQGKWISSDSTLVFTFAKDSLYVDVYPSGCGIAAYKLNKVSSTENDITYYGYETIYEGDSIEINQKYLIKVIDNDKIERHLIRVIRSPIPKNHYTRIIKLDDDYIGQEIEKVP